MKLFRGATPGERVIRVADPGCRPMRPRRGRILSTRSGLIGPRRANALSKSPTFAPVGDGMLDNPLPQVPCGHLGLFEVTPLWGSSIGGIARTSRDDRRGSLPRTDTLNTYRAGLRSPRHMRGPHDGRKHKASRDHDYDHDRECDYDHDCDHELRILMCAADCPKVHASHTRFKRTRTTTTTSASRGICASGGGGT